MSFDRNNAADLLALKNEITNDPNGYGYDINATEAGLQLINQIRPEITIQKSKALKSDIVSATTYAGYNGLGVDEQEWLRWITTSGGEELNITVDVRTQLTGNGAPNQSFWAALDRTAMIAAMASVIDREGSRAEQLFGEDTGITREDWLAARDS